MPALFGFSGLTRFDGYRGDCKLPIVDETVAPVILLSKKMAGVWFNSSLDVISVYTTTFLCFLSVVESLRIPPSKVEASMRGLVFPDLRLTSCAVVTDYLVCA